ncbi:hypothetical protein EIO_1996 [Ketogulonicigenium vulgare Y25]|uniref:hypothetical protein n=1 Tax=Ketogulonicigenium vulgare TaxID=92945 RepID=UPI0001E670EC|nr:hypothetical protein [Ketogulonicigenium vulgare]ADO43105.1 hypothetical protein EIO_1996 [Ketogulonicigenium vulgare Y25]
MIELDFAKIRALRIAGRDVTELRRGAVLMWAKPPEISLASGSGYAGSVYAATQPGGQWFADGVPIHSATDQTWVMTDAYEGAVIQYDIAIQPQSVEISITSGAGFAGSVYRASRGGGQWYADGLPIPGARGQTWTMTIALEGAAISYITFTAPRSNRIQMWTPTVLAAALKEGWWSMRRGVQLAADDRVAAIADSFGLRDMLQTSASLQPRTVVQMGRRVMTFAQEEQTYLLAASSHYGRYVYAVAQYKTGVETIFASYATLWGMIGSGAGRVRGNRDTNGLQQTPLVRMNGHAPTAAVLPMAGAVLGTAPHRNSEALRAWGIGAGQSASFGWDGLIAEVIALSNEPSADDHDRLSGYLAHSWGQADSLPAAHPYKSLGPRID